MADDLFDNLNPLSNFNYIVGLSPDEIVSQIKAIRLPVRIISMYAFGTKHICWFETSAPIKKLKQKEK